MHEHIQDLPYVYQIVHAYADIMYIQCNMYFPYKYSVTIPSDPQHRNHRRVQDAFGLPEESPAFVRGICTLNSTCPLAFTAYTMVGFLYTGKG